MYTKVLDEEIAFNRLYSRFKVQLYFYKRKPLTHYGKEKYNCTVAQIKFKHVHQVSLERSKGLADCIARVDICNRIYGPVKTAIVFDRHGSTTLRDGTKQKGKELMKYVNGVWTEQEQPDWSKSPATIICEVVHQLDKTGTEAFILKPVNLNPAAVDFKKEISEALNKK